MDDVQPVQRGEGSQDLASDELQLPKGEVLRPSSIGLIEVFLQELSEDHKVLSMVEVVMHGDETGFIGITVVPHIPQQLDLIQGLIQVILIVEDDLEAETLLLVASSEVLHLDGLTELGLT